MCLIAGVILDCRGSVWLQKWLIVEKKLECRKVFGCRCSAWLQGKCLITVEVIDRNGSVWLQWKCLIAVEVLDCRKVLDCKESPWLQWKCLTAENCLIARKYLTAKKVIDWKNACLIETNALIAEKVLNWIGSAELQSMFDCRSSDWLLGRHLVAEDVLDCREST